MATDTGRLEGTDLYHEVRGAGPTVLFIAGATGDAEHFARVAARLADEFMTVTYDRRGNSRSRTVGDPDTAATMSAQADDAAALIQSAPSSRAIVVGTSGGAIITLELLARHPEVVRAAIVHEPPLLSLLPPHDPMDDPLAPIFELARTDPDEALERFVRLNTSDAAWDGLDADLRRRMLGNATTLFGHEIARFVTYTPDIETLRTVRVPVQLLFSRDGLPFAPAITQWLHEQTGWPTGTLSGHHSPYFNQPEVMAEELRPLLRSCLAEVPTVR